MFSAGEDAPTRWQKLWLIVKVVELRLRFIVLMAATALVFAYWDELENRYDKWMRPAAGSYATGSSVEFYCPMHPQVVQAAQGTCPICGMPLSKRKKGEAATLPAGITARVELAPFRVRQAGVTIVPVGYAPLTQTLTTVGYVAFDERRIAHIVAKVLGKTRVEKLWVNYTGQNVEVGQTLAELYSPELSQAIQELSSAAKRADQAVKPATEVARSLAADRRAMVSASAEKLRRWGITQAQIDGLLKRANTDFTIPILSPIRGHVFKKNVVEGQEVQEGYAMFEVADLNTVWVQAQVYEHQFGLVHEGQSVAATVEAFPCETFPGKVEFIQPYLDPATRTVEVRYALDNPGHRLRPGMFATVILKTPLANTPEFQARAAAPRPLEVAGRRTNATPEQQRTCPVTTLKLGAMGDPVLAEVDGRQIWTCCAACPPKLKAQPGRYLARWQQQPAGEVLSIPESAVIDTGTRKVVYVETEPGVFEGRAVVLGPRTGNRFPVHEGLAPGERVAAGGAFLIDAESRLSPAAVPAEPGASTPPPPREAEPAPPGDTGGPPRSAANTAESPRTY